MAHVIEDTFEESIPEMVRGAARRFGDRTAFSNMGARMTFTQVDELSDRFGAYLQHAGLVPGDRIAIQLPNLMQYPVAVFGALKAGLVVVNMNPLYTVTEMRQVLADARPRAILVLANFADKVEQALPGSSLEQVLVTGAGDLLGQPRRAVVGLGVRVKKLVPAYRLANAVPFRDAMAQGRRHALTPPALTGADTAFLQYTGGTTGGTKAAVLSHRNLLANQEQFIGQMRAALGEEPATIIAALPQYHVFSLTVNALGFFRFGGHNVLITNPRDLPGLIGTIRRTRPHALVLVSTLAAALLDSDTFSSVDLSRLKITVAGGMALRTAVAERWERATGRQIIEGYGLTEASPVVSVNPVHVPPRPGTIGVPLPSTDVRILDDDGNDVPAGTPGELAVKGPQVMDGYWHNLDATAEVLTARGWLLTGDIATQDPDGYLTIVDRKKEIIVVSGFNVYPGEIEDTAMQHPKVAEAGAIAVPDPKSGEVPKLFVVARDPSLTAEELHAYLRERLAGYKRPRHIEFRVELPKSNVGKVLRRSLRDTDQDDTGRPGDRR